MENLQPIMQKENKICKRCHRPLKDEKSKQLGYGKICYQKITKKNSLYLFEMEDNNEVRI